MRIQLYTYKNIIVLVLCMYAEDMVEGAIMSTPNAHWWATSQTAHQCQVLPQTCPLTMPLMRKVVAMKVCVPV